MNSVGFKLLGRGRNELDKTIYPANLVGIEFLEVNIKKKKLFKII